MGRWGALIGVLMVGIAAGPVLAQTLTLSRDEAIAVARQAYLRGDAGLTFIIASKISTSDPDDVEALLLLSASNAALGHPDAAFASGKQAWTAARIADRPDGLRFEIAEQTASAAYQAGHLRGAARWLARAVPLAPNDAARTKAVTDLRQIRSQIPLTFSGNLRITPTDNLNNGAISGHWLVEDLYIGEVSGWAVAHAGILTTAQIAATYSLGVAPSGKAQNALGFGLSTSLHTLSQTEATENPGLDTKDIDSWTATVSWTQDRLQNGRPPLHLSLDGSQTWFGGVAYSPALKAAIQVPLTRSGDLTFEATLGRQWSDLPVTTSGLHLDGYRQVALPWGQGTLIYGVGATFLRSAEINSTFDSLDASLIFDPGFGGDTFSTHIGIGANWRHYDAFAIGIGNLQASNGRTDQGIWLRAGLGFERAKLAGMTPTLTLQRQMTQSNISKYQTDATSVHFGLAAEF